MIVPGIPLPGRREGDGMGWRLSPLLGALAVAVVASSLPRLSLSLRFGIPSTLHAVVVVWHGMAWHASTWGGDV